MDPEYVLSFEIGQRESGFYSERTDRITDRQTESCQHPVPYYNIDITFFSFDWFMQTYFANIA